MHGWCVIIRLYLLFGVVAVVFGGAVYVSHTAPERSANAMALADARACASVGEPRKMLELCGRAIESGRLPDNFMILTYGNRAYAYARMEQFVDALRDYGAALRIDSTDAQSYAGRAQVNSAMDNWRDALKDYDAAIEHKHDFTEAYYNRALVRAQHQLYDEAIADFTKAIELAPGDMDAVYNRAYTYFLRETYDLAIKDFSLALEKMPENVNALELRGISYISKGDWAGAIPDLEKFLAHDNQDVTHMLLLYVAHTRISGDVAKAKSRLRKQSQGVDGGSWPGLLVSYCLGDLREDAMAAAISRTKNESERQQQMGAASFYIAEQRLVSKQRDQARQYFQRTVKLAAKGSVEQRAAVKELELLGQASK